MTVLPQLERELLEAHRRLGRRPALGMRSRVGALSWVRAAFGAGARVVPMLVAVAVAISVALTAVLISGHGHAGRQTSNPSGHGLRSGPSRSVSVGCAATVSGQLPRLWRSTATGSLRAGPITWLALRQNANRVAVERSHFVEALVVVDPGREVTVGIPPGERRRVALDYTSVAPRPRFSLDQGASSVTFSPCLGPAGQTQFEGGFIVTRAQCAVVDVSTAGSATVIHRRLALGAPCGARMLVRRGGARALGGCRSGVHDTVPPVWARAGFSDARPHMPYETGASGRIAAIIFGPLDSPPSTRVNNKILWVSRSAPVAASDLRISAQRMSGSLRVGAAVARRVAGGPGPSIINLPAPGCWRLTLRWSGKVDTLDLRYRRPG